ncbi:MAG: patatin, partial [Pedobacter sp.]
MKPLTLLVILFFAITLNAQKVGLVLSGGGAKGIAHIGILKALEENNIPVDYITGTSMGGIVGAMYAAGYSPAQIEKIALSSDFQ